MRHGFQLPPGPSGAEAVAAADALGRPGPPPSSELADAIVGIARAWETLQPATDFLDCPDCGGYVDEAFQAEHAVRCQLHRWRVRLASANRAVRLCSEVYADAGATTLERPLPPIPEPPPRLPHLPGWEAPRAAQSLLGSATMTEAATTQRFQVQKFCLAWAHVKDRSTDPCPWCRAVFPLEQFGSHLGECTAHPAHREARSVLHALKERCGRDSRALFELVHCRDVLQNELWLLFEACTRFDADMGWTGSAGYSDKWTERPWRQAVARASRCLDSTEVPVLSSGAVVAVESIHSAAGEYRKGLARLVAACNAFWNGMEDGDRGQSISNPTIEARFRDEKAELRVGIPGLSSPYRD